MTPFKVLYGRDPPGLVRYDHGTALTFEVDRYLQERDQVLEELRGHLLRAQQVMKEYADGKRREVTFEVGDMVFLKLRPYRQSSVMQRMNEKLSPRFYGPYEVLERIGQVAYRLKLPSTTTIHPVFHVSQLKPVVGSQVQVGDLPEVLDSVDSVLPHLVHVRDFRVKGGVKEVLIHWSGLPESESTWELHDLIARQFPSFHLEDKVNDLAGGNVTIGTDKGAPGTDDRWGRVYTRKKIKH